MCVLTLFSCNWKDSDNLGDNPVKVYSEGGFTGSDADFDECDFSAQYIRTDGYHEDVRYPIVKIIRSVHELNDYYEKNKDFPA